MGKVGRRQPVRQLRTPQVWADIPTGARVAVGDELAFSWQPASWTAPLTVHGLVLSAAVERRSWFVAVDSESGRQGTWYVRLHNNVLVGLPREPADPQWWLANPPSHMTAVQAQRPETGDVEGQLSLFDEDAS